MTFGTDFKRFFFRGLAALLPTVLTIWMIVFLFTWIQDHFGKYVNNGAKYLFAKVYVSLSGTTDINEISRIRYQVFEMWDRYLFWWASPSRSSASISSGGSWRATSGGRSGRWPRAGW